LIGYFLFSGTSSLRRSSRTACSEIASIVPISSPSGPICGTTPEVETVMRRRPSDSPWSSEITSMASRTPSKL